ncbi:hypothetical protein O181_040519 [Austropuccinia psidii MF-1]|uniref:Potassium uptake protein n=1 Tax=Austropuccinia psidii MF-1 TaxID=1389203 RepID=A0A9Q3DCL2_9BASI|nr:hypothetical protein [Austropuccinia psidii MF-1]
MTRSLSNSASWTENLDTRYRQAKPSMVVTAIAAVGIIYGDIGTSPLYVMNGVFPADQPAPSPEDALGAISAVIWALTIVPLIKYSLIALEFGTGHGEGGPFALFAQLYPPEKDGEHRIMPSIHSVTSLPLVGATAFLQRPFVKPIIKLITLFAVALILSDGILTPAVSVCSAVSGIAIPAPSLKSSDITGISIAILVLIFFSQRFGTQKLALSFAPIVAVWLLLISAIGIYNITHHPGVFRAFDPSRAIMYFVRAKSLTPLSGILLAITGVEALFANLGQFSKGAIRLSFTCWIYPPLVFAYLGQGATLITNGPNVISNIFYKSIPGAEGGALWWIVWTSGLLATIVASQAMITASFSLIQQMVGLKSFPPVRIIYTSDKSQGQIYAPVINGLLLIGTVGVTAGFGADASLTSAYGFAVSGVLLATTFLLTMVMIHVKRLPVWIAITFFLLAGFIDGVFFASSLQKIPHGAWFTLALGCLLGLFLLFWTWAKGLEDKFDGKNRVKLSQLFVRYTPEAQDTQLSARQVESEYAELHSQEIEKSEKSAFESRNEVETLRGHSSPSPIPHQHSSNQLSSSSVLQISELALHEEPEQIGPDEIICLNEVTKQDSDIQAPSATLNESQKEDLLRDNHLNHQQRIVITEPDWEKDGLNGSSNGPHLSAIHKRRATTSLSSKPGTGSRMIGLRKATFELDGLTFNPHYMPDIVPSGPLPRLECFAFFHHLGIGIGAPHSFSALLKHQPALPRVVVFLTIRVVGVPHLQEEDKYLIDKLRTLAGFYLMTYRIGYREPLDLRGLAKPTLERILELERSFQLHEDSYLLEDEISKITRAANNTSHILPHYHCTSASLKVPETGYLRFFYRVYNSIRAVLLEEIYQRVSQNFPETSSFIVDESKVLRIGVNASI